MCALAPIGVIPFAAARPSLHDLVWITGIKATIMYGTTIILAHPLATATDVWTDVVGWLLLTVITASVAMPLLAILVLPKPASKQVVEDAAELLHGVAKAIDG